SHIDGFLDQKDVELAALCDIDESVLDQRLEQVEKGSKKKPDRYFDMRKLFEDKSIDVVSFATPNHWHSLGAIWAVQAGKDVYVEKPVSHNVWEGRQLVKAARQHHRIVQTGTQSRSSSGIAEAIAWVREGNIGKILRSRGICYKRRPSI